jgi:glycosyltransferase involved in cell wall biosynthesis
VAGSDARERTALIVTVLDEAGSVDALLESVAAQSCPPDEIVIVDGGSRDGTWQLLQAWSRRLPLTPVQAPGATIARGRNVAIQATSASLIAVTDAGVRLGPDWLANLLSSMSPDIDVVAGFFVGDVTTAFERAMAATVLPALDDLEPERFLPSSRSVLFRRAAWQAAGGYPEWLDYCEDLVFDLTLKRAGCRFVFAPDAVAHFRPRGSLEAFFRQYYRYARGDGQADLWRLRHAIRYSSYLLGLWLLGRRWWAPLIIGGVLYTRRPYQRLWPLLAGRPFADAVCAAILVPIIRLVGDIAKMMGYPVGLAGRLGRWASRSSS